MTLEYWSPSFNVGVWGLELCLKADIRNASQKGLYNEKLKMLGIRLKMIAQSSFFMT